MSTKIVPFQKKAEPLNGRSDDDLMLLASGGLHAAFETLVRRHARRVLGFCAKHVGGQGPGEDLAQEIWLAVWDHRKGYRPEGKFVVWLFTLARNRIRNVRRDVARRETSPIEGDPAAVLERTPDLAPSELDRLVAAERGSRLEEALSSVAENLREAILLRFTEELPYDEVARILDTNESTARSRVFHGIRDLRRRLRGES